MINPPKTIEEARAHKYGRYNHKYHEGDCAYEVGEPPGYWDWRQCSRNNGHGIGGLYCKQHAEIVERMMKK